LAKLLLQKIHNSNKTFGKLKGESMNKATASFLILFFVVLMTSVSSFAQGRIISERVVQTIRSFERHQLDDLLRLSRAEERRMEVRSLSITAESLIGPVQLTLSQNGLPLATEIVRRNLREITLNLPRIVSVDELELSASGEIFIDTISAEISIRGRPHPGPGPGPGPNPYPYPQPAQYSDLRVRVDQDFSSYGVVHLKNLIREQLGVLIIDNEIESLTVEAYARGRNQIASLQVELNGRLLGREQYIRNDRILHFLPVNSFERISTLQLITKGEVSIKNVIVRVRDIRHVPQQPIPQSQRIYIGQETSGYNTLLLGRFLPYEYRSIRSITIEARSRFQTMSQLTLATNFGQILGSVVIFQTPTRSIIYLSRPMLASELRLESLTPVMIDSLDIQY
jgi:hypothetical protein